METGLNGRHVLVTGASGGIGLETTRQLLSEGAKVTATYNTSANRLNAMLKTNRAQMFVTQMDVTNEDSVKEAFRSSTEKMGRVDVLVANAGIANHSPVGVDSMSLAQWQNTINVNLTGAFLCAKYFFQNLRQHPADHASLIMIGSTAGVFGEATFCDYATSKAAMHGLMMSLKNEIVHIARHGRVNIVNPGWTLTPMAESELGDKVGYSRILQTIPLRKTAMPEDIAAAILFLASDKLSGHVSGQAITIAGGMEGRVLFTPEETGV